MPRQACLPRSVFNPCHHLLPSALPCPCRSCKCGGCACPRFFFVVAQGAWVLRCRCKHKHVEHDAASRACAKSTCACTAFDSPWVCNCDHAWADHVQQEVADAPSGGVASLLAAAAQEVNDWQHVQRGAAAAGPD